MALETLATKPPATSFPRPLVLMLWLPAPYPSQRSLHSAPIFRLLLKVAVNGTHQCDFHNFGGALCSNCTTSIQTTSIQLKQPNPTHCKNAEGGISPQVCQILTTTPFSQSILAEGAIALSVTLSRRCVVCLLKTTPVPVKFDRQGHSCNFYAGLGPTDLLLLTNLCTKTFALQQSNTSPKVMQKATHTKHKHLSNIADNVHVNT